MFKLKPNPTFEHTVEIPAPGEEPSKLKLIFKHHGKKELKEFFAKISNPETTVSDVEAIEYLVVGWKEVDTEFSKEALELLLDSYTSAATIIFNEYQKALTEGKVKN